jgi:hypothetical protein
MSIAENDAYRSDWIDYGLTADGNLIPAGEFWPHRMPTCGYGSPQEVAFMPSLWPPMVVASADIDPHQEQAILDAQAGSGAYLIALRVIGHHLAVDLHLRGTSELIGRPLHWLASPGRPGTNEPPEEIANPEAFPYFPNEEGIPLVFYVLGMGGRVLLSQEFELWPSLSLCWLETVRRMREEFQHKFNQRPVWFLSRTPSTRSAGESSDFASFKEFLKTGWLAPKQVGGEA